MPEDNIEELLDKATYNLVNLDVRFESADTQGKRSIIGSIFPEKLCFSENSFRAAKDNGAAELIFKLGKAFEENKKGLAGDFADQSNKVILFGLEPLLKNVNN